MFGLLCKRLLQNPNSKTHLGFIQYDYGTSLYVSIRSLSSSTSTVKDRLCSAEDMQQEMFGFLCKRVLVPSNGRVLGVVDSGKTQLGSLQNLIFPIKSFSTSSTATKDEQKEQSFTVSYLVNSCGLSLESAISASKRLHFETPEKPDSVLTFLRNHGFTNTHISKFVRTYPRMLMAKPNKSLLPKLEFLRSIGVCDDDLVKVLSTSPIIWQVSMENRLAPWCTFLKSVLPNDKKFIEALKGSGRFLRNDVHKNFAPNIEVLRQLGVPESLVMRAICSYHSVLAQDHDKFDKRVKEVIGMGFNPKRTQFIHAMLVLAGMTKSTLQYKMELYRRWGLSADEVQFAFKKFPICMTVSEKKIMRGMDFLVNKMGFQSAVISNGPFVLNFSLEKRIIPRCLVIKVLLSKGLIKKEINLKTILTPAERDFLNKFVTKHLEDVPELFNVYQGKMSVLDIGIGSGELCGMKQM